MLAVAEREQESAQVSDPDDYRSVAYWARLEEAEAA